jgi:hypothetical protein
MPFSLAVALPPSSLSPVRAERIDANLICSVRLLRAIMKVGEAIR